MSVPFYVPWADNLLRQATLTVDAEDAEFPIANVIDGNPGWPFKCPNTTVAIVAEFPSAVAAGVAAAIHHTLGNATVLRIQGNTTNSWTTPPLNVAFPTRSGLVGGYRENALADFRALGASYKFYRFVVSAANAVPIWFGQLWLGPATPFHDNFRYEGYGHTRMTTVLENLTYAEVSLRLKKGFMRDVQAGTVRGSYAETATYFDMFQALEGLAEPILVVADPDNPVASMALLDQPEIQRAMADVEAYDVTLRFRELSKGLSFPLS